MPKPAAENATHLESKWAGLVALAVAVPLALLYPREARGRVLGKRVAWVPRLALELIIHLDGFAWIEGKSGAMALPTKGRRSSRRWDMESMSGGLPH